MPTDYDAIADKYPELEAISIRFYLELPSLLAALGDLEGQRVLDLACGTGAYTRIFAEMGATEVVGVDLSEQMLALARAHEKEHPLGITYHHSDVADLPDLGRFDVVAAVYLLHYSPTRDHIARVCKAIAAHLEPGGRFVTAVLNPEIDRERLRYDAYGFNGTYIKGEGDVPDSLTLRMVHNPEMALTANCWSKADYEAALTAAGLEDIEWVPFAVSPGGIDKHGADHWGYYLDNPHATIITARRPA